MTAWAAALTSNQDTSAEPMRAEVRLRMILATIGVRVTRQGLRR
jgi:hypothetical protein